MSNSIRAWFVVKLCLLSKLCETLVVFKYCSLEDFDTKFLNRKQLFLFLFFQRKNKTFFISSNSFQCYQSPLDFVAQNRLICDCLNENFVNLLLIVWLFSDGIYEKMDGKSIFYGYVTCVAWHNIWINQ